MKGSNPGYWSRNLFRSDLWTEDLTFDETPNCRLDLRQLELVTQQLKSTSETHQRK